jgi:hypothetical protein
MTQPMLALRKTDAPGLLPKLFSVLTRARLITRYPHAGIVIDGILYHSTLADGLHYESFKALRPDEWDLFLIDAPSSVVLERYLKVSGAKYDWLSLLAFVVPWRVSVSEWLYCYEWAWYAITGELPGRRVSPEDLLTLTKGRYGHEGSR